MRPVLLVLLATIGCGGQDLVDHAAAAVLEGTVLDADSQPLPQATVRTGGVRYECETGEESGGPAEGQALTDDAGWFQLRISSFLGVDGESCVDLWITPLAAPREDTVHAIKVRFFVGRIADTTRTVLTTSRQPL